MEKITLGITGLHEQSWKSAENYMENAIRIIDKHLGEGYAKQHPELIGKFMEVCSMEFNHGVHTGAIQDLAEKIAEELYDIAGAINDIGRMQKEYSHD